MQFWFKENLNYRSIKYFLANKITPDEYYDNVKMRMCDNTIKSIKYISNKIQAIIRYGNN